MNFKRKNNKRVPRNNTKLLLSHWGTGKTIRLFYKIMRPKHKNIGRDRETDISELS